MFIYMLRNSINGKCYVGLTTNPDVNVRIGQHKNSRNYSDHTNSKTAISRAIKKYGWGAFDVFVLEQCASIDDTIKAEQRWIAYYNCMTPNGYNNTSGGEVTVLSEEERKRRSERMMGHAVSEETRRRIGDANRGRKLTDEHKAKIAAAGRNRKMSDYNRQRLLEANSGELNSFSKLTWEKVRDVRAKYASGEFTQYDLAAIFNVSVATISRIVKCKIWKEEGVEAITVDHRYLSPLAT